MKKKEITNPKWSHLCSAHIAKPRLNARCNRWVSASLRNVFSTSLESPAEHSGGNLPDRPPWRPPKGRWPCAQQPILCSQPLCLLLSAYKSLPLCPALQSSFLSAQWNAAQLMNHLLKSISSLNILSWILFNTVMPHVFSKCQNAF